MSIKRLKHHAQNLCQMFCGWELMFDYKLLAELKNGTLILNVLANECFHNGNIIKKLNIITGLRSWMLHDLKENNIDINQLECVELQIAFVTKRNLGQKLKGFIWAKPTPYYISCSLDCSCRIKTSSRLYTASYKDNEEWPENYSWLK